MAVLRQVAEGVLIHQSEFCQSNAVVVQGRAGVLLIDPGVHGYEMAALANDLSDSGQTVVAGFSTHPHWDHLLWHARLGAAPRYGTARCAATVRDRLSDARWKARIAELIPPDIAEQVPLDLLGLIAGLPAETARIPWDGPARHGVGAVTAAQLLITAGANPGRLRGDAALAALCGASPVEASSGKTSRHRLNRGGDRAANNALWVIAHVRTISDPRTRAFVAKRTATGNSRREIMRMLQRYVARELYPLIIDALRSADVVGLT